MSRIDKNITVGLELECVQTSQNVNEVCERHGFTRCMDHSIRSDFGEELPRTWPGAGTEIVTRPIYANVKMGGDGSRLDVNMADVAQAIEHLCGCATHVNTSCGLHVHLGIPQGDGSSKWSPDNVRTMLTVGRILEQRLFSLVPISRRNNQH